MKIERLVAIIEILSGVPVADLDEIDVSGMTEEQARKRAEKLQGVLMYRPGGAIPGKYILAIKK